MIIESGHLQNQVPQRPFVEIRQDVGVRLPFAPPVVRDFLADAVYENLLLTDVAINPRGISRHDWSVRGLATTLTYYGTDAPLSEIASVFSLHGERYVAPTVEEYLNRLGREHTLRKRYGYLQGVRRLKNPQPEIFEEAQEPQLLRIRDFEYYLRRLYIPDAQHIFDRIQSDSNVIIDAGHGIGKSMDLFPLVDNLAKGNSYETEYLDAVGHLKSTHNVAILDRFVRFPTGSRRLVVMDEFQNMVLTDLESARKTLEYLAQRGIQTMFLIPRPMRGERMVIAELMKAWGREMGYPLEVYTPQMQSIPADLARKKLLFEGNSSGIVDFVLAEENRAFLHPAMFSAINLGRYSRVNGISRKDNPSLTGAFMDYQPGKANWRMAISEGWGSSKEDLRRLFTNLGILTGSRDDPAEAYFDATPPWP